jgi:hypothetical protein
MKFLKALVHYLGMESSFVVTDIDKYGRSKVLNVFKETVDAIRSGKMQKS